MPPRPTLSRSVRASAAAALMSLPAMLAGSPAGAVAPPYTMEERAFAIASPSLVYIENQMSGYVRRTDTGTALHSDPISFTYRCTGFVVESQGHVVTSTRCVQPSDTGVLGYALSLLANDLIKKGQLPEDQKDVYLKDNRPVSEFTGNLVGSKPTRRIMGQLFQGQSGLAAEPAIRGEVLQALPGTEGGVALIKFPLAGMPTVEISQEPIRVTAPVVLMAFGRDSGSSVYVASSKTARINGRLGTDTPAKYQLDGDLGPVSHGGMVVDSSGRVAGIIDDDPKTSDTNNRQAASIEYVQNLLIKAGITNSLSATDVAYRSGLDSYFGGRYGDAIGKLDNVISVMPDHALANNYRRQAGDRLSVEGDAVDTQSSAWVYATVGLAATQLISLVLIGWLLMRRRSAAFNLYQPVSALPISAYPVSATPISGGYQPISAPGNQPFSPAPDTFSGFPQSPGAAPQTFYHPIESDSGQQESETGKGPDTPWAQKQ